MENLCMNTNAGLLPCDFEIEDINVAQKYSDLCEATCKNIMGYFSQVIYLFILIRIFLFHFYKRFPGLYSAN